MMNQSSQKNFSSRFTRLWWVVLLTPLLVSLGLLFASRSALAQTSMTGACISQAAGFSSGCSANDLRFGSFSTVTILDGCSSPTDTYQALISAELESGAGESYDVAVWINLDGTSALTGTTCYREILSPITTGTPNLTSGSGPYRDLESGDACGDVGKNESTFIELQTLTLSCSDTDRNGLAAIPGCISWDNNKNTACNNVSQAIPGTTSKCSCGSFPIADISVPDLRLTKTCTPDRVGLNGTVSCTINYSNVGFGNAVGFSLVDNYDQSNGSVSNIGNTIPGGFAGTNNGDTITWQLPTIAPNGSGSVTYEYTVKPDAVLGTQIKNTATIFYGSVPQAIATDETVTVVATGNITIRKETDPDGRAGQFGFTSSATPASFTLSDGGSQTFSNIEVGNYTFGENLATDWNLTNITCTQNNSPIQIGADSDFDAGDSSITVNLGANDNVVCTFTNTIKPGKIIVVKQTTPDGAAQAFDFTLTKDNNSTSFPLTDGQTYDSGPLQPDSGYAVSEPPPLPRGWSNTIATCDDGSPISNIVVDPDETVTCTFVNEVLPAAIGIDKTASVSTLPAGGGIVTYNYVVTNQGQTPLSTVAVSDDKCTPVNYVNGDDGDNILEELETWNYSCTTTITADTTNLATATAKDPVNATVTKQDTAFVDVQPSITVVKSANPTSVPESGADVAFTIVVNNTSSEPVTLNTLTDDMFGPLAGEGNCTVGQTVAANGSYSCTFTKPISGDFPGSHVNIVTAEASDDENNNATNSGSATVTYADVLPDITLEKSANPTTLTEPGGLFNYTLRIHNNSTEDATITGLSDTYTLSQECTDLINIVIPAGGTVACPYSVSHTAPDTYPNTAQVAVKDDENNTDSAEASTSVTVLDSPSSLAVSKTANPTSLPEPGGQVQFTVRITNTSAVDTITLDTLTDDTNNDNTPDVTYQASAICNRTSLAPNQVAVCTFTQNITGNAGALFTDKATVFATDDDENDLSGNARATVSLTGVGAQISVSKTPNPAIMPEPGGSVVFTVRLTNLSTIDVVTINELTDSVFANITTSGHDGITATTCSVPQTLAVNNGAYQCTFTAQVTGDFGQNHSNTVSAIGVDDDGQSVAGSGPAQVIFTDVASAISVVKTANPTTVPESGGNVQYTIVVTNTGTVDSVTINNVVDDKFGDVSSTCQPALPATLAPTNKITCSFTRFVQGNAGTTHVNEATATGLDDDNAAVSGKGSAIVTFTDIPASLTVSKQANPTSVPESGGTVQYTVIITNTSVADTVNVTQVTDDKFGDISTSCPLPALLAPGEKITCTFSRFIQGNAGATHTNIITARGTDDDTRPITGIGSVGVPFTNLPASATLAKTASSAGVSKEGGVIVFTVRIDNTSVVDSIVFTALHDSVFGNVADATNLSLVSTTCTMPQTVPAGQNYTCTFSAVIQGAVGYVHINTVTATGTDDDGQAINPAGSATVTVASPLISATKSDTLFTDGDQNSIASPGDVLEYTVLLRNTGNVAGTAAIFNDTLDPNSALVVGSVTTSQGTVTTGNTAGDTTVSINIGDIQPGGAVTIRFRVTIDTPLPEGVTQIANQGSVGGSNFPTLITDDPATPTLDDPTTTPITAGPRVTAVKSDQLVGDADGNGLLSPGDTLAYRITIANNGNQNALTTFVNDQLDNNTTLVVSSVQSSQGTVVQGNNAGDSNVEVNLGTIAAGQSVVITFRVIINDPLPAGVTRVSNQGIISGSNFPSIPTDDPDTPTEGDPTLSPVAAAPVINATKRVTLFKDADNDGEPSPGDYLLYQVTIINSGNIAATNIVFIDKPDLNTSLLIGTVQASAGVIVLGNSLGDSEVNVQVGTLAGRGGEVTISYQAAINKPLPASVRIIQNQGFVSSQELPTIPTDDPTTPTADDPTSTTVRNLPVLSATKRVNLQVDADNDGVAEPGDTLRYEIAIENSGNAPLTNVIFSDTIDSHTTLIANSVQSNLGTVIMGNHVNDPRIQVNIGTLVNGGKAVITYLVRIDNPLPNGVTEIKNQGVITSNELPPLPTDDPVVNGGNDPTIIPVVGTARLQMRKSDIHWIDADDDQKVTLGDTLMYEIYIDNIGNSGATNVLFQDAPDPNTGLLIGSVKSSRGTITKGNNADDTMIEIEIGALPAGEGVKISFLVQINLNTDGVINNHARVSYLDSSQVTGVGLTVLSDDPETQAKPGDPTETVISGPTALEESEEPGAHMRVLRIFLPAIRR